MGKSTAAHRFSAALGYSPTVTMHLYHDMSARDLLQRRATTDKGDTVWETTPLIEAALGGAAVVLDGIDRLHPSTFSVMQQLCQDRECTLFDGTKLVRSDRFDHIAAAVSHDAAAQATPEFQQGGAEGYLRDVKKILRVSPSFRIVAVASLPTLTNPWMTSEVLPMFRFHYVRHFRSEEKEALLEQLFPQLSGPSSFGHHIVTLDDRLRKLSAKEQEDAQPKSQPAASAAAGGPPAAPPVARISYGLPSNAPGFSLRQLIRLCRQFHSYPDEAELQNVATLADTSTPLDEDRLDQLINRGFRTAGANLLPEDVPAIEVVEVAGRPHLRIGSVQAPLHSPEDEALIPKVNFFNMPKHVFIMQEMLKDFTIGGMPPFLSLVFRSLSFSLLATLSPLPPLSLSISCANVCPHLCQCDACLALCLSMRLLRAPRKPPAHWTPGSGQEHAGRPLAGAATLRERVHSAAQRHHRPVADSLANSRRRRNQVGRQPPCVCREARPLPCHRRGG